MTLPAQEIVYHDKFLFQCVQNLQIEVFRYKTCKSTVSSRKPGREIKERILVQAETTSNTSLAGKK